MQKAVIFVKRNLKDKKYHIVRDQYAGEYRGAVLRICNLKYI